MRYWLPRLLLATLVAASAAACSEDTITAPTPAPIVTDTFTGTLTPNGAVTHPFNTAAAGTIKATLTTVAPDSTLKVGISLGTWNGTACQAVIANDAALQAAILTGTTTTRAALCVRLYDVGNLPADTEVTYSVSVEHP